MTANVNYLKCAYCGIKQFPSSMIIIKKSVEEEWSAIFGEEFRRRLGKYRHICMKHLKGFENEKDDDDDQIQWFYENGRKICFNTFCCYCGPKTEPIKMCAVTTNDDEMDLWVAELGKKFQINASKLRIPCICLRHFEGNEVLPRGFQKGIPYDVLDELGKTSPGFHACAYCLRLRGPQLMVKVPKSLEFQSFAKAFGVDFEKNCRKMVDPQICRSHVIQNLPKYKLPALKISDLCFGPPTPKNIELKAYCCYCGRKDIQKRMINVPSDQNTIIDWVCILGMDFEENCSFVRFPMVCRSHVKVMIKCDPNVFKQYLQQEPIALNPKPDFSISKNCRGVQIHLQEEPKPSSSVSKNHEQIEISDEQKPIVFDQMEPSTSSEFPEDLVLKIEPPEIKQEIKEEIEEEEELDIKPSTSGFVSDIHITAEITRLIENAKRYEKNYNPRFGKCCYCRSFLSVKNMIRVPNDPNLFEKWCEILGNTFKLISSSLRYPRICWQHFEDQGIITKRIPIANLKDINLSPCCMYCNFQTPPCLDIVTIRGSSFEAVKWRKILGIRARNLNLYICYRHLEKVV